ncbi:MAG: hypothetical protein RR058_04615 [Oscillospiraceae bacterium]
MSKFNAIKNKSKVIVASLLILAVCLACVFIVGFSASPQTSGYKTVYAPISVYYDVKLFDAAKFQGELSEALGTEVSVTVSKDLKSSFNFLRMGFPGQGSVDTVKIQALLDSSYSEMDIKELSVANHGSYFGRADITALALAASFLLLAAIIVIFLLVRTHGSFKSLLIVLLSCAISVSFVLAVYSLARLSLDIWAIVAVAAAFILSAFSSVETISMLSSVKIPKSSSFEVAAGAVLIKNNKRHLALIIGVFIVAAVLVAVGVFYPSQLCVRLAVVILSVAVSVLITATATIPALFASIIAK